MLRASANIAAIRNHSSDVPHGLSRLLAAFGADRESFQQPIHFDEQLKKDRCKNVKSARRTIVPAPLQQRPAVDRS